MKRNRDSLHQVSGLLQVCTGSKETGPPREGCRRYKPQLFQDWAFPMSFSCWCHHLGAHSLEMQNLRPHRTPPGSESACMEMPGKPCILTSEKHCTASWLLLPHLWLTARSMICYQPLTLFVCLKIKLLEIEHGRFLWPLSRRGRPHQGGTRTLLRPRSIFRLVI